MQTFFSPKVDQSMREWSKSDLLEFGRICVGKKKKCLVVVYKRERVVPIVIMITITGIIESVDKVR